MITGVHHTSRVVSDMDRALGFYRGKLGMRVLLDTEMRGDMLSREVALEDAHLRLVELAAATNETVLLELLQYYAPPAQQAHGEPRCNDLGAHHPALLVDDINDAHRRLVGRGVRFTCDPQEVDAGFFKGHWTAYCYDPDGQIVELWQTPSC
jgi:catechol 2,3-dioxygenase-like lactoylglutathione lyase family enzyme